MKTHFLNIDLDLYGLNQEKSKILLEALGEHVCVMYNDLDNEQHLLSLELMKEGSTITETLNLWLNMFTHFPPKKDIIGMKKLTAQLILKEARKVLDIGVQAGTDQETMDFNIPNKMLFDCARHGIELKFTIYGSHAEIKAED